MLRWCEQERAAKTAMHAAVGSGHCHDDTCLLPGGRGRRESLIEFHDIADLRSTAVAQCKVDAFNWHSRDYLCFSRLAPNAAVQPKPRLRGDRLQQLVRHPG